MSSNDYGFTCIHAQRGLCPRCQADYDEDPLAWIEYGEHPAGIAAWKAVQDDMDRAAAEAAQDLIPPEERTWDDIPF